MNKTKLGAALGAAITVSGCIGALQEKPDINETIRSVSATATDIKTGTSRTIAAQPVDGREGCEKFANSVASTGFNVEADCISGADGTGRVVSDYSVEYIEPPVEPLAIQPIQTPEDPEPAP